MYKKILMVLLCALLFTAAACAQPAQTEAEESTARVVRVIPDLAQQALQEEDEAALPLVGVSLRGEGGLEDAFSAYAVEQAQVQGCDLAIMDAGLSADQQIVDIAQLLARGIQALIVNPVDIDSLQYVMDECALQGVKVINLLEPINGKVDTLIMPDYALVGEKAARLAKEAKKDRDYDELSTYLLEGAVDSFVMQMMHDGFVMQAEGQGNTPIEGVAHFNDAQEQAALTGWKLADLGSANVVFAQNEPLAAGFLEKTGARDTSVIVYGCTADTLVRIKSGDYYAAVFFGPRELAEQAVKEAVLCAASPDYLPPAYIELTLDVASASSVDEFLAQGLSFAEPAE